MAAAANAPRQLAATPANCNAGVCASSAPAKAAICQRGIGRRRLAARRRRSAIIGGEGAAYRACIIYRLSGISAAA